jgi:poly-beta-hydroxybutyrate-responsive repressor
MCQRHGNDQPCTCAMGNLYRFVEPVVLLLLKKKGHSYGYDLSGDLREHALTDAEIERGALYRTLRQLELNGNVASEWETDRGGPARRVYKLTARGERHLEEWATVLEHVSKSMARFVKQTRQTMHGPACRIPPPRRTLVLPRHGMGSDPGIPPPGNSDTPLE